MEKTKHESISRSKRSPYHIDTGKVKELQKKKGIGDWDLAFALRLTTPTIHRTIRNVHRNLRTQQLIAHALGVPLAEIITT